MVEESSLKNGGAILVPLDLSLFSESAIPYAEELASSLDMTIVLFHVFLPARESIIGIPEIGSRKEEVEVRTWHLTDYFNSLSTRLENKGVRVQYQMTGMIGQSLGQRMQFALNEAISQQLVARAVEPDVRMVLMTTQGGGATFGVTYGGVVANLIDNCPKPLFLVRVQP